MILAARFNGPPDSANGGYTAGLLAAELAEADAVEVTLRRRPPLDTELTLVRTGEALRAYHDDALIAEAVPAELADDEIVAPASFPEAADASRSYHGFIDHPFPSCFVCGPDRADGLRLFPGRLPDDRTVAPFIVPRDMTEVLMWAALDCPGGWAVPLASRQYVLGRIAARVDNLPEPGAVCVVVGRMIGEQGRKAYALTTVYGPDGTTLARARATWLAIPDA